MSYLMNGRFGVGGVNADCDSLSGGGGKLRLSERRLVRDLNRGAAQAAPGI